MIRDDAVRGDARTFRCQIGSRYPADIDYPLDGDYLTGANYLFAISYHIVVRYSVASTLAGRTGRRQCALSSHRTEGLEIGGEFRHMEEVVP